MHRFLLIFVVLAVAISPLRGAFASLAMSAGDPASHCAGMTDGQQADDHMAGMHDPADTGRGTQHDKDCGGDCCDGTCHACAHGLIALVTPVAVIAQASHSPLVSSALRSFTGRTVHPPFRPPISLRG